MYAPQHAAPKSSAAGRHRRPARTDTFSHQIATGVTQASALAAAAKPGPRVVQGVSVLTVGSVGFFGMAAPAHADGETLNFRQIAGVVKDVGLPCASGTAIAYAESGGDTGVNSRIAGEDSRGLFQINEAHGFDFDWDDAHANARKAKEIYEAAGGWSPWGAYTNGSYEAYLDEAGAACDNATQISSGRHAGGVKVEPAVHQTSSGKHRMTAEGGATYTVEAGDTLAEIASDHGTTWQHLWQMNPQIEDPDSISVGAEIDVSGHPVQ